MKTITYYFSATGNSLHFAKNLALELGNCELVNIAESIKSEKIEPEAKRIGLIFPVFAWGSPRIVIDFLEKLRIDENSYIFSVVTCVGIPARTLPDIRKVLRRKGSGLHAGFVVKAACSSLMKMNFLDKIIIKLDKERKRLKSGEERLPEIVSAVSNFKEHKAETSSWLANIFGTMFHSYGVNYFKTADKDFQIADTCSGCGTCVKVCPRSNINIKNGKPVFYNNCEFCHACIQWCPQFTIKHPDFDPELPQYRHPEAKIGEFVIHEN